MLCNRGATRARGHSRATMGSVNTVLCQYRHSSAPWQDCAGIRPGSDGYFDI